MKRKEIMLLYGMGLIPDHTQQWWKDKHKCDPIADAYYSRWQMLIVIILVWFVLLPATQIPFRFQSVASIGLSSIIAVLGIFPIVDWYRHNFSRLPFGESLVNLIVIVDLDWPTFAKLSVTLLLEKLTNALVYRAARTGRAESLYGINTPEARAAKAVFVEALEICAEAGVDVDTKYNRYFEKADSFVIPAADAKVKPETAPKNRPGSYKAGDMVFKRPELVYSVELEPFSRGRTS